MALKAKYNDKLEISIIDKDNNKVNVLGEIVQKANNRPLSYSDIYKQITKVGNTVFQIKSLNIDMDDNIFIPNKFLNDIRRNALDQLKNIRENKIILNKYESFSLSKRNITYEKNNINVLVRNLSQLRAAIDAHADNIYITDDTGTKIQYKVYKNFEANASDTSFYRRDTQGKREITLSTCTEDANTRTIVLAREV